MFYFLFKINRFQLDSVAYIFLTPKKIKRNGISSANGGMFRCALLHLAGSVVFIGIIN